MSDTADAVLLDAYVTHRATVLLERLEQLPPAPAPTDED